MPDASPDRATPTTKDLRAALNGWDDRLDFDRWLAEHDAQVRAEARKSALLDAADMLHSEARWQYERHVMGHVGAQTISLRVSRLEQILRDWAA